MDKKEYLVVSHNQFVKQQYMQEWHTYCIMRSMADLVIHQLDIAKRSHTNIRYADCRTSEPCVSGACKSGLALMLENTLPVGIISPWGKWRFVDNVVLNRQERQLIALELALLLEFDQKRTEEVAPIVRFHTTILSRFKPRKQLISIDENAKRLAQWREFTRLYKSEQKKKNLVARL